jgi:SAM-dependent methyltransferase
MPGRGEHWEHVYATRSSSSVGWYQQEPVTSLRLVEGAGRERSNGVIDVGGGASSLVDHLLADGYTDLTLLDVSQRALDEVRTRLGNEAHRVRFLQHDVLTWEPERDYDVWHDRAVFHFLTDVADRDRYADTASRALRAGGSLVVATFAADGPTECSGLPVCRYSAEDLEETFSGSFLPVGREREVHTTPGNVAQPFTWVVLRRTSC